MRDFKYKNIRQCRFCFSEDIKELLTLGKQFIGSNFVKDNKIHPMALVQIPLTLLFCKNCHLVQLKETTNPELLYNNYFYRTAINDTMKKDLKELVDSSLAKTDILLGDYVLDVGANDMTMLQMFPEWLNRVGVEPAKNINWNNVGKDVVIINDYFSQKAIQDRIGEKKFKLITSCACFYDMEDPVEILKDFKKILDVNGVLVIQVSHLLATVKDNNFYDLCHEHLMYYSLEVLDRLMRESGFYIFDVETNFVNGGSIRIYCEHYENRVHSHKSRRYYEILCEEWDNKINKVNTYYDFKRKIQEITTVVKDVILKEAFENDGLVIGLGASTKGNVLLQACGLDYQTLPAISERNQEKIGLYTLGTNIPLISEKQARDMKPAMMFVLPWSFKQEIVEREKEYIDNGGKLLFAMPYPYILSREGEFRLNQTIINNIDKRKCSRPFKGA